jgi:hypothetical protein
MLGHLTGAKMAAIATLMAKKLMSHGMLAGKHPDASHGLDTIVENGRVPVNFH